MDCSTVEQLTLDFYGEPLAAVRCADGSVWIPLRRLCEMLGLDLRTQLTKIQGEQIGQVGVARLPVTLPDGRTYLMECLALRYARRWLLGLRVPRVKVSARRKLMLYQQALFSLLDQTLGDQLMPQLDITNLNMESDSEEELEGSAPGYIYLIKGPGSLFKIGMSRTPETRMRGMQTGWPHELHLVHKIATDDMYWAERYLHEKFEGLRETGEWFALSAAQVDWFCKWERLDSLQDGSERRTLHEKPMVYQTQTGLPGDSELSYDAPGSVQDAASSGRLRTDMLRYQTSSVLRRLTHRHSSPTAMDYSCWYPNPATRHTNFTEK